MKRNYDKNSNNHIQQNVPEEDKNIPQKNCSIRLLFSLYFYVWWSSKTNRIIKQTKEYLGTNIVRRKEPRKQKSQEREVRREKYGLEQRINSRKLSKNWMQCAVAVYLGS
jgi:hypothetical protein